MKKSKIVSPEYKVRAWDTKKKAWVQIHIFRGGHKGEVDTQKTPNVFNITEALANQKYTNTKHIIVMPFSGLLDRNKVEIFSGDVIGYVRGKNDRDWLKGHDGMINKLAARAGVVEFRDGKFVVHWHYGNTYGGFGEPTKIRWTDEYVDLITELNDYIVKEVLGTIYENPELINPKI